MWLRKHHLPAPLLRHPGPRAPSAPHCATSCLSWRTLPHRMPTGLGLIGPEQPSMSPSDPSKCHDNPWAILLCNPCLVALLFFPVPCTGHTPYNSVCTHFSDLILQVGSSKETGPVGNGKENTLFRLFAMPSGHCHPYAVKQGRLRQPTAERNIEACIRVTVWGLMSFQADALLHRGQFLDGGEIHRGRRGRRCVHPVPSHTPFQVRLNTDGWQTNSRDGSSETDLVQQNHCPFSTQHCLSRCSAVQCSAVQCSAVQCSACACACNAPSSQPRCPVTLSYAVPGKSLSHEARPPTPNPVSPS